MDLLRLTQAQKSYSKLGQLQENIVNGRMRVAGQQNTEATGREDPYLQMGDREKRHCSKLRELVDSFQIDTKFSKT